MSSLSAISRWVCTACLLVCCSFEITHCQEAHSAPDPTDIPDSLVRRIDDTTVAIGQVTIVGSRILVPGSVNMSSGPVEYFAVTPGGKTHESVIALDIKPLHLQTALLLLGLECGQNLEMQGDTTAPAGDSVVISVSWRLEDDSVTVPAANLLFNTMSREPVKDGPWVFTGSIMYEGRFLADYEGSIIATYSDPVAILNTPMAGRYDDTSFGINEELIPPVGTEILLIIEPL